RAMRKALLAVMLALPAILHAQPSGTTISAQLTAACTNATTACDSVPNSQLKFGIGEYSLASVTAKGAFTGSVQFFEFSDDGGVSWFPTTCTRNDAAIQELSEAIPDNTNRSWDCGVGAARVYRIRQGAIGTGGPMITVTLSSIQIEPAPTVSQALPNTQFAGANTPGAGTQAGVVQAAAGTNIRNVATLICFSGASTTAPALTAVTVNLRDGASGAGAIKGQWQLAVSASTGQNVPPVCFNVNFVGSPNTAMTLEWSAGVANLLESVTLHGYTT